MFFKIGLLKKFTNFTEKHLCWSLTLVNLQAWFTATLLKRDSDTGIFLWNLLNLWQHLFLHNTSSGCFYVYQVDHALLVKLICRDSDTGIFLWILRNFLKNYWSPPVAASFCLKMKNIKIHFDSYMQWAHCLMVSIVSEGTSFYLLQRRI